MTARWVVLDGWTMTRRNLTHWAGQPGQVAVGLLFPVMVVLMFGYLFGGEFGPDYREFLLPGMFAMTMVFGLETTFAAVATDAARGVTDRFRSMPMAGSAVVAGRAAADLLYAALGLAVMVGCGLAVGWRYHGGTGAALLAVGLLLLLRFALLWVGIYLGLVVSGPEALVAVQILVWPLGFLSNVFAAPDTMPGWLAAVAEWNPLSATVAATRHLFGNPGGHPTLLAVAWPVVLTVVFSVLSVRRYRGLSR
jgi:ABC transporter DrrB family efflux protein